MKQLLTLLVLTLSISINAQSNDKVTYVSAKKDTLIVPNNSLGLMILKVWDGVKNKPVIITAEQSVIDVKNASRQIATNKPKKS